MREWREKNRWQRSNAIAWVCLALLLAAPGPLGLFAAAPPDFEMELADAARQKLSTAETRSLGRADKVFGESKFAEAVAEYDVFLKEFPKSAAAPYALVRKGRATQKAGDAPKALRIFNEAMDLYSDSVECAVPSLYFSGQCQAAGRDVPAALKAWKEIAEDKDYRKHPGAAYALGSLAGLLLEQGKPAEATKCYLQEALDFPKTREAVIEQLLIQHIARNPSVEAVREMVKTLNGLAAKPQQELATDEKYFWETLRKAVREFKGYGRAPDNEIRLYCCYWAGVLEGNVPREDDDAQIELTGFHQTAGMAGEEWTARLDKQFSALQKPGDYGRIVKWILLFAGQPEKAEEYYAKLDFGKMTNATIVSLLLGAVKPLPDMAKRVCAHVRFEEMDDGAKASLLGKIVDSRTAVSQEIAPLILARMKNPDSGRMAMLRFWTGVEHVKREVMAENGLPLAEVCISNPACAKEANGLKASLLKGVGRLEDAIQAYRASDDPPRNLLAIADCYIALGQLDKAVEQWREVAKKFESRAPEMAFKIAYAYRDAGQADKYEAELREITRTALKNPEAVQQARAELDALKKPQDK